mmetsp:Transcript_10984/g.15278  ORF Transcript_10984/g.15278 Transcript_10984/m.15278 type:complete len:357 (-) Transcript_10984:329-1399(-)|eukprot:CAMPEP_0184479440 /NCGR_PEP_ID=MMETSP0113_2-20130426/1166_1 /TAXON_ID=91329 /ORGANISM="Norrisiella sphaerica, Strain BC52" /LENGTH=356 /DNA_ID=CAMNT_0026857527 /DNA_START=177 /DNA_END=1247 /DNA_ORIENTATION=+
MAASIILFIVVIQFGVAYIAGQKGVDVQTRRYMTLGFFGAVVACMVAYDIAMMDPSYYDILGVSPSVDDKTLKRAYKSLSKKLHPDKNPNDPDAQENFILMQEVYDILSTRDLRETYDAYGQEYMINARISPQSKRVDLSYERLLMYHAPFYFISALVAYALTISKKANTARPYAFVMLFGLAIAEWYTKTYHEALPYVPLTIYQQVECLKNIYHYLLQGAIMYANLTYIDLEMQSLFLLSELKKQLDRQEQQLRAHETILRILVQHVVGNKKGGSASSSAAGALPNGEDAKEAGAKLIDDALSNLPAQAKKAALERKRRDDASAAIEKEKAKQGKEHPWSLYIFIGLSLLNYFSK